MLGYVHLLPETRPALERRTVAGTALWVLEGDLDGGLLPRRRLRRWTRVLAERFRHLRLSVGPGQEALERQLLRQLGLTTGGGAAAVTVTFGPQAREGCAVYLTPDCARRQRVDYIWRDGESPAPEEPLLAALHRAGRLPDVGVKSAETLDIGP